VLPSIGLSAARRIATEAKEIPASRFENPDVPLGPILSGEDLIEAGMEEGPEIGEVLEQAHRIQVREGVEDKQELLERASDA